MGKLKVPSLQHLARNWRQNPQLVMRILVALAHNSPTFNYNPLFAAVRDMLVFGVSYEQIVEGINRGVRRKDVRENFLGVLPLLRDHFKELRPTFVQAVERRYYPVARGLLVPFDPPLIYGAGGKLHFPWFSFWRSNPIAAERLSLFVSLVDDVLLQDPDLEDAEFKILDFSAPRHGMPRELSVIPSGEIPRISQEEKAHMLAIFAEGYFLAKTALAAEPKPSQQSEQPRDNPDSPGLFE
jgi:hypothetical protein